MNILFVNYGDFTTNSLNHIGAFANRLTALGHGCVVAVPEKPETLACVPAPAFVPALYPQLLAGPSPFPDGRPADVIHAWTPRENVREFVFAYLRRHPARLLIHLEDNEEFLLEAYTRRSLAQLRAGTDEELRPLLSPLLSHPQRFRNFLRAAGGVTCITDRLREFVPPGIPARRLLPGVDFALYQPRPADAALRRRLKLAPADKVLVFTGSTTFANFDDIRALLLAVRRLNESGTPCKLIRTGINPPQLVRELALDTADFVIDLGFVAKQTLGDLLALADALVQPGAPGAFNDYRLPSKVPEFLSAGKPVVLPRANLAREMMDGRDALLLETGDPDEIAAQCRRIFTDPALARALSAGALAFARAHFDLPANTDGLLDFYRETLAAPAAAAAGGGSLTTGDALLARALRRHLAQLSAQSPRPELAAEINSGLADLELRLQSLETSRDLRQGQLTEAIAEFQHLESEHRKLVAEYRRVRAMVHYWQDKLAAEQNTAGDLRQQLAAAGAAIAAVRQDLAQSRAQTEAAAETVRQRERKIARMSGSFSWRITAPLRSLRRLLLDHRRKTDDGRPVAPPPPQPEAGFSHNFDEPADWGSLAPAGCIRGWCLGPDGQPVVGVRLRCADRTLDAAYGLSRPDVAAHFPTAGKSAPCGFYFDYEFPADSSPTLIFEALTAEGAWRCFALRPAHVTAAGDGERRDYGAWIRRYDTPALAEVVALKAAGEAFPRQPLISILLPVFNPPEKWLVRALESVCEQYYPHWELCVADDASTAPHVRRVLEDFRRRDERIKVVFRETNGHISAASNSALELATGEYAALFDHDDELAPHALHEVAAAVNGDPGLVFLYSDEDKIDELGHRSDPYFKPDWNPDLLLGQNYTCHLSVFRRDALAAAGGFRPGYEGSQDWDLTLRVVEKLAPAQIRHIPKILYHWRAIAGSTALVIDEKSYPVRAAEKLLRDHLDRLGVSAQLLPVAGRHWRIRWPLPSPAPKVSLIIPTHNARRLLRLCVGSILALTRYPDFELIVVNNRSDEPEALAYLRELAEQGVRVLDWDRPFNFSALNNFAATQAGGEVLAFLNNDLEVISGDWLEEMTAQALRPGIGAVGAMLYYPDDTVQHAGVVLGVGGLPGQNVAGHAFKRFPRGAEGQRNRLRLVQNYSAVTAACLVVRKSVFEAVGGFNETDLTVAFNDIDFCLKLLRAGYRNLWTPFAEFYHHESASRGSEDTPEKHARFAREIAHMRQAWGPLLDRDPAYNPNLTLAEEDFALAWPPRDLKDR